jgi:hypothetical protein
MDIAKCPVCGMPVESSNYYLRGMAIKCRHCNHSGLPLAGGACIYDRIKIEREPPRDPFRAELSLQSIFSKLALMGLFCSLVAVWFMELRPFTAVSFSAFLLFSAMYGFLRLREG